MLDCTLYVDFSLLINHIVQPTWLCYKFLFPPLEHFQLMYLGSLARSQLGALTKTAVVFKEGGHDFCRKICVYLNHFPKGKKAGGIVLS